MHILCKFIQNAVCLMTTHVNSIYTYHNYTHMHIHECIWTMPHMHKCVQEGFDDALIHLYYMQIWTHGYPVLGCWWHECICTHTNMPCIPRHKWVDYRNHTLINTCMFAYNHWQRDNHKHTHTHTYIQPARKQCAKSVAYYETRVTWNSGSTDMHAS